MESKAIKENIARILVRASCTSIIGSNNNLMMPLGWNFPIAPHFNVHMEFFHRNNFNMSISGDVQSSIQLTMKMIMGPQTNPIKTISDWANKNVTEH